MEEKVCAKLLQTILQLGSLSENCGHKMSIADRNNVSYNPMLENCTQDINASEANFHIYSKNKYFTFIPKTNMNTLEKSLVEIFG